MGWVCCRLKIFANILIFLKVQSQAKTFVTASQSCSDYADKLAKVNRG